MEDNTLGGCGNDFAMDDITFRECIKPSTVIQPEHIPVAKPEVKQPLPDIQPALKKTPVKTAAVKMIFPGQ